MSSTSSPAQTGTPKVQTTIDPNVMDALIKDFPDLLEDMLRGGNPLRQFHLRGNKERTGIQTVAVLVGAWKCLTWLHDRDRFQIYMDELDKAHSSHFRNDLNKAAFLLNEAASAGDTAAETCLPAMFHWVIKLSDDIERADLLGGIYKGSHFAHTLAEFIAEEEHQLLSNPKNTSRPRRQKNEKSRKPIGP